MPERLLIVKLADIGDLVTATPAIEACVETFPSAQITVLTSPHAAPLLRGLEPRVDVRTFAKADFDRLGNGLRPSAVTRALGLAYGLFRGGYDQLALLHHLSTGLGVSKYRGLAAATRARIVAGLDNGRGSFLDLRTPDHGFGAVSETEYALRVVELLGARRPEPVRPRVWLDEAEQARGRQLARDIVRGSFVALHPGTGRAVPARRWPAQRWVDLLTRLDRQKQQVLLVGGEEDRDVVLEVEGAYGKQLPRLVGGMTLAEVAGVIAEADVFCGADSGLVHLAAAQGTRVLAMYGPTGSSAWAPHPLLQGQSPGVLLQSRVSCSPCLYQPGRHPLQIGCRKPFCMHSIDAATVTGAVQALLQARVA